MNNHNNLSFPVSRRPFLACKMMMWPKAASLSLRNPNGHGRFSQYISTALGIHTTDFPSATLCSLSSFSLMGGYYLLQPMSDAMALCVGIKMTPVITAGGLAFIMACNPLYAWLVRTLDWDLVQPVLHRILSLCLVGFAAAFGASRLAPERRMCPFFLSTVFASFTGAFSLFLMSTFWVRMAHVSAENNAPCHATRLHPIFGMAHRGSHANMTCLHLTQNSCRSGSSVSFL